MKGLVSQGRFDSEEAAVVEGIRLLMGREHLRGEIKKGIDQLDNGECFDDETVFAEVNAEIDKIESRHQQTDASWACRKSGHACLGAQVDGTGL